MSEWLQAELQMKKSYRHKITYSQYPNRKRDCFIYSNSRRAVFSFYIVWYNDFLFHFYGQKKRFSSNWVSRHWLLFHIQRCPEDGPFSQFPMCYLVRWFYQNFKKCTKQLFRLRGLAAPDRDSTWSWLSHLINQHLTRGQTAQTVGTSVGFTCIPTLGRFGACP